MSENVGNSKKWWEAGLNAPQSKTIQQGDVKVQTGYDTQRPSTDSDIGKLFNRQNPTGVLGQINGPYG